MDKNGILEVLTTIEAEKVRVFRQNVQCACFLADYREGHSSGSDHADSMGILIDPEGQSKVNCFACKFRGTLKSAVEALNKHSKRDFGAVLQLVGKLEQLDPQQLALSIGGYGDSEEVVPDTIVPEVNLDRLQSGAAKDILDEGISKETLMVWDSRCDDALRRTVLPVRRFEGELVGAVGRSYLSKEVRKASDNFRIAGKYYNYWGFDKSRFLFGENMLGEAPTGIVVEGLLDTVAVWQWIKDSGNQDNYSAVGLLGSMASNMQVKKLSRFFDGVILFLDNDAAGWSGNSDLAKRLKGRVSVRSVRYPVPVGLDPRELLSMGTDIGSMIESSSLII